MAGSPDDLSLLIKLLNMTTVSEDNMCLVAIRKANRELQKFKKPDGSGGTWEDLLRGRVTVVADPFASIPKPPQADMPPAPTRRNDYSPAGTPDPADQWYAFDAAAQARDAAVMRAKVEAQQRQRREDAERQHRNEAHRQRQRQAEAERIQKEADAKRWQQDRYERERRAAAAKAAPSGRTNQYKGQCRHCRRTLAPGEGDLVQVNNAWTVQCPPTLGCLPSSKAYKGYRPTADDISDLLNS